VVATVEDRLEALRARPERVALIVDYDGTLAPIVEDAAAAVPHEAVPGLLTRLAPRLGLLAVVSGRPLDFLHDHVPAGLALAGLYGLEVEVDGRRQDHPQAGNWREVVDDVAARAEARCPAGVVVERKGLSVTLHYRTAPEHAEAVAEHARAEARRSGLLARPARMSWELHPPIDVDKGTAVLELADDFPVVVVAGDDVGDLPAYDALDRLEESGVATLRIAVASAEAPPQLLERADLVVDGPEGLVALLTSLG
jgi:trehalose 6-phosphate phosphatase